MSLLERTKHLLRSNRIVPNKFLGQNFMIDRSIFECLSDCASLNKNDIVLDIGAGLGILTRFLADKCSRVLAVESDPRLARVLHEQLAEFHNVSIVKGNILKVDVSVFNKVVSIPPYQISSRLMLWLFDKRHSCAVLVFQKEFACRLVAAVGSDDYGWLTVLAYFYSECELLDDIPRTSFHPQPKVDSVIVRLVPKKEQPFPVKEQDGFAKLVRMLFTQRNRKVRNAAIPYLRTILSKNSTDANATAAGLPFHDRRVRELAPEDFGELANAFA